MIVVDYSAGRIAPNALKAAGVVGVCRYLSWLPNPKVITKAEYDELVSAGIRVTLNWEFRTLDWLGGSSSGSQHAAEAVNQAKALGYPKGQEIIGSADFDMSRNQWLLAGRAYAIAFANGIRAGGYRPGGYGPYNVLQWLKDENIVDAFWQAGMSHAWTNNNQVWPGAHLFQHAHLTIAGTDTDYNDVLVTPLWGKATTKGKDMLRIAAVKTAGSANPNVWYVGDGIFYAKINTWHEHEQAMGDGAVEIIFEEAGDWKGHVGRTLAGSGTSGIVTQEQINAAFAANVVQFAAALASHFKVS